MKQKTKQLQSSGETRKTNRTWHFLSTLNSLLLSKLLLLLIIPAIGSTAAWATDEVVTIGSKSGAFTISGTSHTVAGLSSGTNSATITAASDGQTASAGSKMNVTTNIGSKLSGKAHIRFTVVAGETVRLYVYWGSDSQSATFRTSDYSQSSNYLHEGKLVSSASKNTLQFVDFTFENAGTYAISVVSGNNPFMAAIKFTASSAYTVTFNANGHGLIDGNATKALTEGSAGAGVTPPTVTAASGYTLAGTWHTAATCTEANKVTLIGGKYMPSSNGITLYAGYNYKVTFDAATNGGTCGTSNLTQTSAGASITLPEATKTGYNLNGWFTASTSDTNRGTSSYVPTDNETLYAQFTAKTYTITLNANGGDANKSTTATYNSSTLTSWTAPTKSGNTLTGYWTAESSGTKVINADGTLVANVDGYTTADGKWKKDGTAILYAQWAAPSGYTITYDVDGRASAISSEAGVTALPASLPSVSPHAGYNFTGWFTDEERTVAAVAGTAITENTTLYANYQIIGSISSSPIAGSTVKAGDHVYTTATTSASGVTQMRIAQGGGQYNAETLKSSGNLVGITDAGWSVSGGATLGTDSWVLSALLTDGKYYSDVLTNTFSVGVAAPSISCSSNTVTITSATTLTGTNIYYTLDGKEPTSSSTLYSAPFAITETKTVKAIAIKSGSTSATTTRVCEYGTASTALPVTFDFTTSPWSTSTDFSGAVDDGTPLTILDSSNNHNISFYGNREGEFSIKEGSPNYLQMTQNGATNHFIAIPMSNINGRIDIEVWAPYAQSSNFTIRAVLDTGHGTTVQSAAPSAIKTAALDVNDYKDGHFYFRMKDLTATEGVLYIGPASSSYKDFQKIKVTSPAHYLIPDKASVTMGDGSEPETVTITNYSAYPVLVKTETVPSYVNATYEPSTGKLTITPKAVGSGENIELCVDTDGNGVAGDTDLSIPVTVTGITNVTAPTSAVYDTSSGSYSPALDALSVTATKSATGNTGTLAYQWYSNTVNSNTGGTVISGATSNTLSTDKISTTDSEKAAFYYCVVSLPGDSCKSVASDVAYVLTSKSKRYFHMSNVAGNRQTSDASEKITGEIVAGGTATAIHGADSYYRYITRPSSSYAHMYVVSNANNYIKINLKNAIATNDVISVLQMGNQGTSAGIKIATDASGSNAIDIDQDGTDTKTYSATFTAAFNGVKEIYILGKYEGHQNYFTDLYISKPAPLAVSAPTPASQTVQTNETPGAFVVKATGGTGSYTYAWKQDTDPSGSFNDDAEGTVVSDGGTSTFTPTSKSVASNTNYYYKCIVTSGASNVTTSAATLTVTALTHGYYTPSSFTDNKNEYLTIYGDYTTQNTGPITVTDHYWSLAGTNTWDNITISGIDNTSRKYLRIKKSSESMTFYVKNARAFSFITEKKDESGVYYTFTVSVDDIEIGDFNTTGKESVSIPLNTSGSKIVISGPKSDKDIYIGRLTFYEKAPATINIMKNGEEVSADTKYMGDGATEYEVETNGDGTLSLVKPTGATDVTNGYRTTYAEVTLNNGILSVTPLAATPTKPSTPEVITIEHTDGTSYADARTTLNVTVKKHTLALAFSYEKASFKASTLTSGSGIPNGSLPTLTATRDGVEVTGSDFTTLGIRYMSDDTTIGSFASNTSYAITYGGGQGGARIYAYVGTNQNVSSAKAYFDLVVEDGTSNALPSSAKSGSGDDKQIYEQKQFRLANSQGVEVVRLTYGGYKYGAENGWRDAEQKGKYYIDGYQYYTRHGMDALDEYGYQLRGMSDEEAKPSNSADNGSYYKITKSKVQKDESIWTFNVNKYGNQNVGSHKFWYASGEGGTTGDYQRIHPFTLPTRGGYLKFEPKQTGKLTVYVWQNGTYSGGELGSKPRLGYWFDQDGWVQHPTTAPITKQPLSENMGSDHIKLTDFDNWKNAWKDNGDDAIKPLLTNKWCSIEKPNWQNALTATYKNDGTKPEGYYENPFYWMTKTEIGTNLNEEETIISKKMTPVPFHNGYMVPEASYLKYKLNVVAGKTYYFYGMMTKIGYVGMNFVEDDNVTISDTGKKFYHQTTTLHLNANDNMATVVANSAHGDATTYLGTVYDEVTLPSNYKKGQWSTICLPFPLSESQVEEAFGKGTQLTIYNGARKKGTGVYSIRYLSHVDRNILAGQPYFIKPSGVDANGADLDNVNGVIGTTVEGASGTRITFNTVCIDANFSTATTYGSDEDVNASGTDIDQKGYKFVGAYNNETLPTYSYIVSKGELRRFTGSTTKIPTYYAYLKPNTTKAQQGGFSMDVPFTDSTVETAWVINGDDDTTDVISMEAIADAMNNGKVLSGKAYNMMGQEVDPTSAKGIVIIDGKKYMFK